MAYFNLEWSAESSFVWQFNYHLRHLHVAKILLLHFYEHITPFHVYFTVNLCFELLGGWICWYKGLLRWLWCSMWSRISIWCLWCDLWRRNSSENVQSFGRRKGSWCMSICRRGRNWDSCMLAFTMSNWRMHGWYLNQQFWISKISTLCFSSWKKDELSLTLVSS